MPSNKQQDVGNKAKGAHWSQENGTGDDKQRYLAEQHRQLMTLSRYPLTSAEGLDTLQSEYVAECDWLRTGIGGKRRLAKEQQIFTKPNNISLMPAGKYHVLYSTCYESEPQKLSIRNLAIREDPGPCNSLQLQIDTANPENILGSGSSSYIRNLWQSQEWKAALIIKSSCLN